MREAQRQITLNDPLTDLVCTIDIGSFSNVHPENKFDAGLRVANSILANFGIPGAVKSGPTFSGVRLLRLFFAWIGFASAATPCLRLWVGCLLARTSCLLVSRFRA